MPLFDPFTCLVLGSFAGCFLLVKAVYECYTFIANRCFEIKIEPIEMAMDKI